jgi:DNA polymerase-1
MSNKITLLIDGNNTLHRTHWIANNTGKLLVNSKGVNVGSIFTFLKTIKSYVDQFNANEVYIAWDRKLTRETPNFRNVLTNGTYKGTRDHERNKNVYDSMDEILAAVDLLGIKNIFPGHLEADDVISWLSKSVVGKKIIISVDRDFIQLVAPDISYYNPIKKQLVDNINFEEVFELTPREYLYFKAIVGDKSDNLPGVEGYGEVKGMKLARLYRAHVDSETLSVKDTETINTNKAVIESNLKLMDLSYGLNQFPQEVELYSKQVNDLSTFAPDFNKFKEVCVELEFNSILNKIEDWQATFLKKHNENLLTEYFKAFE